MLALIELRLYSSPYSTPWGPLGPGDPLPPCIPGSPFNPIGPGIPGFPRGPARYNT